jgi:hypothetical protein
VKSCTRPLALRPKRHLAKAQFRREMGADDEVIMRAIARYLSPALLSLTPETKRRALDAIAARQPAADPACHARVIMFAMVGLLLRACSKAA